MAEESHVSAGVMKSKRSIWRLSTITDFFWSIINFIGVFFATMFSMEKSDAYRKGSGSGKKWDGGGPGGGPYGGGPGGPRGPRGGLDNVLYLPVVPAAAECGHCAGILTKSMPDKLFKSLSLGLGLKNDELKEAAGGDELAFKDGHSYDVKYIPNALIIHIGDQIEIISKGKYKSVLRRSTLHKEKTRMSWPVFLEPPPDFEVGPHPKLVDDQGPFSSLIRVEM
ncbi:Flavonol synthase/flavanone 3-hydroxylase [Morus notabilis]|uniref:Flavonol synthase/flavanone 3-hydroxylase n=1 Tax=Morus notabilis TaxID=981085 RepID=W9QVQ8_9ROSA|nr:Flavonol synthase/flavanone 3-hydroxylase [Morus notabilis]